MINVTLKESSNENNQPVELSTVTKAPIVIEEQLDASLDSGTLNYLSNELPNSALNEPLAGYTIDIEYDDEGKKEHKSFDFVGMDSRAVLRKNYVEHTVKDTTSEFESSEPLFPGTYYASGKISVKGFDIRIIKVDGDIRSFAFATYSNGEISWNATIFRNKKPMSYTVTIVYVSNDDNVYSHQVALTEPSKLLQGVMIDGFGVSQPEDYASRKTLQDVMERLLAVYSFDDQNFTLAQDEDTGEETIEFNGQRFTLTNDKTVVEALQAVKSPQFKWNTQTTLWECLLQVGAVIDAMPRLVADDDGNYTVVTFDFVNAYVGEEEWIDDGKTNAIGENVNEIQYNTALSAIVENLRENE